MSKGSEQISEKWVEGAKRECIRCGARIRNLQRDVGEVRNRYPGPVTEIICMDCHIEEEAVKKVDLSTWGGTKVRNRLKKVWLAAELAEADVEFGQYQQSLATTIQNTNELIDKSAATETRLGVLESRPF